MWKLLFLQPNPTYALDDDSEVKSGLQLSTWNIRIVGNESWWKPFTVRTQVLCCCVSSLLWTFYWKSWLHLDVLSLTLLCSDVHELTTYHRGRWWASNSPTGKSKNWTGRKLHHFSYIFWIHSFTLPAVPTRSMLEWEGKESTHWCEPNMIASVICKNHAGASSLGFNI